jgi:VCBS repeat protein
MTAWRAAIVFAPNARVGSREPGPTASARIDRAHEEKKMMTRISAVFASILLGAAPYGSAAEFLHAPAHTTGLAPYEAALADMDGDGDEDVVTVDLQDQEVGSVSVSLNDGAGGFSAPAYYPVGPGSAWLDVGDLNQDGRPDVVVSNSQAEDSKAATVYMNNGSGGLVSPHFLTAGTAANAQGIKIGDWNGDGQADVAVALMMMGQVKVFWGNGTGNFPSSVAVNTGTTPRDLAAADFNADGHLDFVVTDVDGARVFYGTGAGFQAGAYIDNFPKGCDHVAAGDFNGDGRADFVTTGQALTAFLGDGTGSWIRRFTAVGENPVGIASGDLDGDGKLDVAAALYLGGAVSVYYGNGSGDFPVRRDWGVGFAPNHLAIGDLNGDSKPDIVAPSSQLSQRDFQVLLNGGGRTFLARRDFDVIGDANGFAVADFDRDGNQDVIVAVYQSNADNLKLIRGNNDGTMKDPVLVETFGNNLPTNVIAADFNADGWMDAAASIFSPGDSMRVLINNGQGGFLPSVVYPAGGNPGSLAAGDINGDGHLDVIVVNSALTDNTISVFIGVGNGTFFPDYKLPTLVAPSDLVMADFDKDGDLDVLVTHGVTKAVLLFVNNGSGNLTPLTFNLGVAQGTPNVADLNGDGWLDVALSTGVASVLFNNGGAGFTLQQGATVASGGLGLADFDHDGDTDLVAADFYRSLASVLLNDGTGHFTAGPVIPTGYQTGRCTGADFGKDALPEIVTANVRAGSISFVTNTTWTAPASARVLRGVLVSGGVVQARVSDDAYMKVGNGPTGNPNIGMSFVAASPTFTPASITFTLEASVTTTGLLQSIELFDSAAGAWVTVDVRPATLVDQVVSVPLTDPARFVAPGSRAMTARIRLKADGAGAALWTALVDRVAWTVR